MNVKILGDRVLVKEVEEEEKTTQGLVLVRHNTSEVVRGIVQAVGEKVQEVKVGETVLYRPLSGQKITLEGEEFRILSEEELIAVLEK
ncbi:MAG: co-chaperone GroES [Nitrososphaeria archaeon]